MMNLNRKRAMCGIVLSATLGSFSNIASATAKTGDYCLNAATGGSSCSFSSMEQCLETQWGRNGWCSHVVDFGERASKAPLESFAYDPPPARRTTTTYERRRDEEIRKHDMPTKGVGAE
jgi:hypothetical protein